jgi:hypothetical protein
LIHDVNNVRFTSQDHRGWDLDRHRDPDENAGWDGAMFVESGE